MSMRHYLRRKFSPHAGLLQTGIQCLILISLISMSLATMSSLPRSWQDTLRVIEIMTLIVFSLEYAIRIVIAENRARYVFSIWGIIDFLAIVPSILLPGIDLKALRALRFLRLLRILKLARYSAALTRLANSLRNVWAELAVFICLAGITFFIAACGIYYFEHEAQPDKFPSIPASMWWAIATLTTVGYGDVYPVTVGGKIFTFLVLMIGLGLVSIPAGLIASSLTGLHGAADKENEASTPDGRGQDETGT